MFGFEHSVEFDMNTDMASLNLKSCEQLNSNVLESYLLFSLFNVSSDFVGLCDTILYTSELKYAYKLYASKKILLQRSSLLMAHVTFSFH